MKKKLVSLTLALAMTAALVGCGNSKGASTEENATDTTAAETATENTETGTTDVADSGLEVTGDNITISLFAGSIPENTPTGGALATMADYINKNSNGTIEAQAFYDTALGDATSMVQGLQQGTVDIGVAGTAYFSGLVGEIEVFQLPFLFDDLESARSATSGPAADDINKKFEDVGIVGLSFWENGFRELTNSVRPVSSPADMQGIKMRTLPAEVQVKTWEAFGATATTIDASELYTALQQGTVNAQDNPLHEIVSRAFYEVQPYVTMTDATYTPLYMAISKMTWDRMSESQQQLIREAAEVAREKQFELTDVAQESAKQTLIDNGCEIIEDPDKEAFKKLAMPQWSVFTDKYGTDLLNEIQNN